MILEAIAGWMAASKGLVFTPQHDPRKDGFVFPYGITPAALESWASVFQPQDLWTIRAAERGLLQEGRVVLDKELASESELLASAWYRDFLATLDIGRVLSGCIFGPGHAHLPMTAVSLFRSLDEPPFSEADRSRFQLVFPHLSRALGVMMSLRDAEFRVAATRSALDKLNAGVLLLDEHGGVSFSNAMAHEILAARDGLSLRPAMAGSGHEGLSVQDPVAARVVKQAIDAALTRYADADHFLKLITIPRPSGAGAYTMQVSTLGGQACFGIEHGAKGVIAFIVDPDGRPKLQAHQFVELYGLTQAEARVAVCLVNGDDLSVLARILGVSVNTVKTQVKKVYEKMNVDSRATFMRVALSHSTIELGAP